MTRYRTTAITGVPPKAMISKPAKPPPRLSGLSKYAAFPARSQELGEREMAESHRYKQSVNGAPPKSGTSGEKRNEPLDVSRCGSKHTPLGSNQKPSVHSVRLCSS